MKKSELTPFRVFLISFLVLLAANIQHLMDPPYWDAILGVYNQGVWLYRHGFNFALLSRQPTYNEGGPNVTLFYALAPVFALLRCFFSPPGVFLSLHLFVLMAASFCLAIYYRILNQQMTAMLSVLWLIAAASNPIWSGQVASIYLEIPMSALLSLSAYYFWKKNYKQAALWCFLAYFMKSAAVLQAAVYACLSVGFIAVHCRNHPARTLDRSLLWLMLPAPLLLVLNHCVGGSVYIGSFVLHEIPDLVITSVLHIPYLYPTMAMEVVLIAGLLAFMRKRPADMPWFLFLLVFTAGFWSSFLIARFALVRYTVMVQLPMIALLAWLLADRPRLSAAVSGVLILLNLLNQHGQTLRPLPFFLGRSGDRLERSREYLMDLAANRQLCRLLEEKAKGEPIVAKWPFTQMLRVPEFGYVQRPYPVVIEVNIPPLLADTFKWQDFRSAVKNDQTLCIYSSSVFENVGPSLRPRPGDIILWADTTLRPPLVLFRRRWKEEELPVRMVR